MSANLRLLPKLASPRSVSAAELAQHARALLKATFPGVKFSVRSSVFSGGSAVRVSWTDGPRARDVDKLIDPLSGRGFDGMTDSTSFHDVTLPSGEVVRNSTFTSTRRETSPALEARMAAVFERATGYPLGHRAFASYPQQYTHRLACAFDPARGVFVVGEHNGEPREIAEGEADFEKLQGLREVLDFADIWRGIERARETDAATGETR